MTRVWVEIDCNAWHANYRALAAAAAPAEVVPVVKSDCYGLGARRAAAVFIGAGAGRLAVATLEEAQDLADVGVEIQMLGAPVAAEIPGMVAAGVVISVPDVRVAEWVSRAAVQQGRTAQIHVLLDSGMGRLGLLMSEAAQAIRRIAAMPGITIEGVYSHLPAAEIPDAATLRQIAEVTAFVQELEDDGFVLRYRHVANSSAVGGLPASIGRPFNMVRPGIDLHAAGPPEINRSFHLTPVLCWKTRLVAVRRLPKGFTIGYNRTYRLTEEQSVGTIAVGYADGYPRSLSNRGEVLVRGRRCPVIGSVCMDYSQVSLRDVPGAAVGDEVVLIGCQGGETVSVHDVATAAGTITYEILTGLGPRVARCYQPLAATQPGGEQHNEH